MADLGIEHDLWRPVPPGGHVLGEETRVVVLGVGHPRQPEVADLEVTGGVEQEVGGLEVPVQHVGRVDVLEAPGELVRGGGVRTKV